MTRHDAAVREARQGSTERQCLREAEARERGQNDKKDAIHGLLSE